MEQTDSTDQMANSAEKGQVVRTILVIDDCVETIETLESAFLEHGVVTSRAATAVEARKLLEEQGFRFDVVILDLNLPDCRGELLLEWIKLNEPSLPVIIISAEKSDDMLIHCLNKGASDFIEKPFRVDQVLSSVTVSFRRRAAQESVGEMQAELHASDWIELTAQTEIEYLGRIQRFSEVLFTRRLPQKVVDDLRLAMEEFGRNAIEWGNKFSRDKQFRISYCFFPDRVVLKFEDEGEGFNPQSVPDPSKDPIAHLKRRQSEGKRPGGFGLFMMNRIMDEIFYNERGNTCIMTKYLPKDGVDAPEDDARE